jgi:EAL domain-containing protein (putative c-di-GMP-specific phosphodiesterase class I)
VTGTPIGVEALIRWTPPGEPIVSPASLIPLAERTGLIKPITEWVVDEICAQTLRWQQMELRFASRSTSRRCCGRRPSSATCSRRCEAPACGPISWCWRYRVGRDGRSRPDRCDRGDAERRRHALAIDDFGTGYSSLSRLNVLPAGTLKVDRSFVYGLPGDRSSVDAHRDDRSLARGLGMEPLEGTRTSSSASS